ncbi:MAG: HAD family hydrolase [Polyangiaceae bacterium]|nr:HAD family hydrolase [Polyangiaceae bacterium]
MSNESHAALFDMDRTLVRRNTSQLYTRYQRDIGQAGLVDALKVAMWMLRYSVGLMDAERVAERALRSFRGQDEGDLLASCKRWFSEYVLPHVADEGRRAIEAHRQRGDTLVLVTASTQYAAVPLAEELGIPHVICTKLEVHEGTLTGRVDGNVCFGKKKIDRVASLAEEHGFNLSTATFYSDSITDLPLLEAVGLPVAINPDARLRRIARKRDWRIERWG